MTRTMLRKAERHQIIEAIKWNDRNKASRLNNAFALAQMTGRSYDYVRYHLELMRQMEYITFSGLIAVLND